MYHIIITFVDGVVYDFPNIDEDTWYKALQRVLEHVNIIHVDLATITCERQHERIDDEI